MNKNIMCSKCGKSNPGNNKFCSFCGADLVDAKVKCPKCGTENDRNSKFCNKCGTSLIKAEKAEKGESKRSFFKFLSNAKKNINVNVILKFALSMLFIVGMCALVVGSFGDVAVSKSTTLGNYSYSPFTWFFKEMWSSLDKMRYGEFPSPHATYVVTLLEYVYWLISYVVCFIATIIIAVITIVQINKPEAFAEFDFKSKAKKMIAFATPYVVLTGMFACSCTTMTTDSNPVVNEVISSNYGWGTMTIAISLVVLAFALLFDKLMSLKTNNARILIGNIFKGLPLILLMFIVFFGFKSTITISQITGSTKLTETNGIFSLLISIIDAKNQANNGSFDLPLGLAICSFFFTVGGFVTTMVLLNTKESKFTQKVFLHSLTLVLILGAAVFANQAFDKYIAAASVGSLTYGNHFSPAIIITISLSIFSIASLIASHSILAEKNAVNTIDIDNMAL